MITTKFSYLFLAPALIVAGGAAAQTSTQQAPNQVIEKQIEERTAPATATTPNQNTMGEAAATAQTNAPIGSGAAVEWVGKPLAAIDGTKVGTVSEVKTDQSGTVTEIRAKIGGLFGWLFTREIAIPASSILLERDGSLVAEMSADEIKRTPSVSG
jgi:hypothetical protein